MQQKMRRSDREMVTEDMNALLKKCEYGILSTISEDQTPYGVPMNYAYAENRIYLHGALEGHKLNNIRIHQSVCFTVVGQVELEPSKFTTKYESVIVFGKINILNDLESKRKALVHLLEKLSPTYMESGMQYLDQAIQKTQVFEIIPEHITGKARE